METVTIELLPRINTISVTFQKIIEDLKYLMTTENSRILTSPMVLVIVRPMSLKCSILDDFLSLFEEG